MKKIIINQNKVAFPLVANHFKRLTFLFVLLCSTALLAQKPSLKVGDNPATINTSAALDAESTTKGFLPPRMTTAQRDAIVSAAKGLIIYNISLDCLQVNKGTTAAPTWECIGASAAPSATADCNTAGFVGSYVSGVALSGATYTVTVTNSSFAAMALTNNTSDLTITGVSGVTVLSVSPATLNLASAASGTITYTLQGTPAACGTLQGVWTKLSLTCTKTKTVSPNVNCATASWTAAVSPAVSSGLTNNTAYTGTYSIPYTGGGCTLPAENLTQSGLTLAFAGGTIGASGNLVYTLSGTYTGTTGGSVTFTTFNGCIATVGLLLKSCKEIKTALPSAADGVYTIDPDGSGSAFGSMQVQCDMTTDGGGWSLIANYVQSWQATPVSTGGSGLPSLSFTNKFPLILSTTLGNNEVGNTTSYGCVSGSMLSSIGQPTNFLIKGKRSNNNSLTLAVNALLKGNVNSTIWNNFVNLQIPTIQQTPVALPGNTARVQAWSHDCCSPYSMRSWDGTPRSQYNFGFWGGQLLVDRDNDGYNYPLSQDNATYQIWIR